MVPSAGREGTETLKDPLDILLTSSGKERYELLHRRVKRNDKELPKQVLEAWPHKEKVWESDNMQGVYDVMKEKTEDDLEETKAPATVSRTPRFLTPSPVRRHKPKVRDS